MMAVSCSAWARDAACSGPFRVSGRVLPMDDGREITVWYPDATTAGARGPGARPDAACVRWPVVLFSHGLAGCGTQAVFITERIARAGYVVVAPNHHDALCGKDVERRPWDHGEATEPPFLQPEAWDSRAHRDRLRDLREAMRRLAADPDLARIADGSRIGLVGHSLGGYTALGVAGAWPDWRIPGVRAVVAYSPYVAPFLTQGRLAALDVPVMYQGGTLDFAVTSNVSGEDGAFARSPAPKFLVELAGGTHVAWTNWLCGDRSVGACLDDVPNARLIDDYTIAFLDRYLKGAQAPLLEGRGEGLAAFRAAPR